jgi:hypothetical protein
MSGWIFAFGMLVVIFGIGARLKRREDRQTELAKLDEEIRLAKFWGYSAEDEKKSRADMIAGHGNWRSNIKFELSNWIALLIGGAIVLIATVLWLGEGPSHTWDQLWNGIKYVGGTVVGLGLAAYAVVQLDKRLDRANREISWLNHMLKQVKDHAEVSLGDEEVG